MPNALADVGGPPPAPNDPNKDQANAPPMAAMIGGNALAPPQGASPQQQQQQAPAPSHQQTVAAIRHFDLIERELEGLLSDPDLGKSDMRSKIIDGATKLVAEGVLTPSAAVMQLGSVPDKPFDQKVWAQKQFAQAIAAANAVLDHHRNANLGQDIQSQPYDSANHIDLINSALSHYQGLGNAG